MNKSPKNTQYLFIDMNAFFASCEQQTQPQLRNTPVAVTPYSGSTGCIISPSYEAKKFGIKTGTLVKCAKELCPKINIIESNTEKYLYFHKMLKEVLFSFSPFVKVLSVDEAVIKLSPSEQNSKSAKYIAQNIKQTIHKKLGNYMNCSIGIAPNIYLAKQAAEYQKPNGLIELKLNDLEAFYRTLELKDLTGINFHSAINLNNIGIYKPVDLFLEKQANLRIKLGISGEYWYFNLHGFDMANYYANSFHTKTKIDLPKSISHSHVLEPKYRNWQSAWSVCQKLADKAVMRLRKEKLSAQKIFLYVKTLPQNSFKQEIRTDLFCDNFTFINHIKNLWQKIDKSNLPFKIIIRLSDLKQPWAKQTRLFYKNEKLEQISQTLDKINYKYGLFTIKPANILISKDSAPNRISFGKPL